MDRAMFFGQSDPRRPKRLAEECFAVCIGALQRRFGKRALLQAIRQCEPIRISVPYNPPVQVWLTYDTHPLPGKGRKWSSLEGGTARIWFVCPGCRKKVAKLFYYVFSGSTLASDLLCRCCHRLTYLSVNCAGNQFYERVLKPYRRLQSIKERLQAWSMHRSERMELEVRKIALENYLPETIRRFGRRGRKAIGRRSGAEKRP